MILVTLLLWLGASLTSAVTVLVYRRVAMPRWRRRVAIVVSVAVAVLMAPLTISAGGWVLGLAFPVLLLSAGLLGSAWAWKAETVVARFTDDYLDRRPDLQQLFTRSPILCRVMKVRDWSRGWWA